MFTLAHLSDWHATPLDGAGPLTLANKRFFGWLSWKLRRSRVHRPEVLGALIEDLRAQAPDHVAVTGDLTNVALESEFHAAAEWLRRLGAPDWVSLVPGNHDAYIPVERARSWDLWAEYLRWDDLGPGACAPAAEDFPTTRTRGPLALLGVCTALPTPLFQATGQVGEAQLERLEARLRDFAERGLQRVVLLHHPPTDEGLIPRRRLVDAAALRDVIRRAGAELVLHGHRHRSALTRVDGPSGEGAVPVVGVRSASDGGEKEHKRAQYHLYRFERDERGQSRIMLSVRGLDRESGCFRAEGEPRPL